MLKHLFIQNYIIIDSLHLDFENGMSVFTGETGAGKSIIVDALGLLSGERGLSSVIRNNAEKAIIEAVFQLENKQALELLLEAGFEEEDEYIFTRILTIDGKSTTRINHRTVTYSFMKDVLQYELDIHSQHDTQYLLDSKKHIHLLDEFIQDTALFNKMKDEYLAYTSLQKEYEEKLNTTFNVDDEEFLLFQIQEINDADLKEDEEEYLQQRQKELSSFTKINETLTQVLEFLDGNEGVIEKYHASLKLMDHLLDIHELEEYTNVLKEKYYEVDEVTANIKDYFSRLEFDESEYNAIQERLFLITKLKRKYGSTVQDILNRKSELEERCLLIQNRQEYLSKLESQLNEAKNIALKTANLIHDKRIEAANQLQQQVIGHVHDLMLPNAIFEIQIHTNELKANGTDTVEFYISTNKGESLKPLSKVASGGELSRFMLGLKVVFSLLQGISTIIFDEVDSGVSGSVASSIGFKMRYLSKGAQVLAITHLSQVAACANYHYLVYKDQSLNTTLTYVKPIVDHERIQQLAMLSSGSNTEIALHAAKELLETHQSKVIK